MSHDCENLKDIYCCTQSLMHDISRNISDTEIRTLQSAQMTPVQSTWTQWAVPEKLRAGEQTRTPKRDERSCREPICKSCSVPEGVGGVDVPELVSGFLVAPEFWLLLGVAAISSASSPAAVVTSQVLTWSSPLYAEPHLTFTPLSLTQQTQPRGKTLH